MEQVRKSIKFDQNQVATLEHWKMTGKLAISRPGENAKILSQQNRDVAYNPQIILL